MKRIFALTSSVIVASSLAIACGSAPTQTDATQPPSATQEAALAVVPATGSAIEHGISQWNVYAESAGLRAEGVDAKGNVLENVRVNADANGSTIEDLGAGGVLRVDAKGNVLENSLADGDRTAQSMNDLHVDMQTFSEANPNAVGFACGWEITWALAACSLVYPACVGTAGLACIGASLTCAQRSQVAYACLSQPVSGGGGANK